MAVLGLCEKYSAACDGQMTASGLFTQPQNILFESPPWRRNTFYTTSYFYTSSEYMNIPCQRQGNYLIRARDR